MHDIGIGGWSLTVLILHFGIFAFWLHNNLTFTQQRYRSQSQQQGATHAPGDGHDARPVAKT